MLGRKSPALPKQAALGDDGDRHKKAPSFREIRAEIDYLQSRPLETLLQPLWVGTLLRIFSLSRR